MVALKKLLKEGYSSRKELFNPLIITCKPTTVRNASDFLSIISRKHGVIYDYRVLPKCNIDAFLKDFKLIFERVSAKYKTVNNIECRHRV